VACVRQSSQLSYNCKLFFWPCTGIASFVIGRCFDKQVDSLRAIAAALPERRTGDNTRYSMADIALSAFASFFTQCLSFLSFQNGELGSVSRSKWRLVLRKRWHAQGTWSGRQQFSLWSGVGKRSRVGGVVDGGKARRCRQFCRWCADAGNA